MGRNTTSKPRISVIIPVYAEMERINQTIAHVRRTAGSQAIEVVVADGGPEHATLVAIEDPDVVRVKSPQGRGTQMNAGAVAATGDVLLFLHADTLMPDGWVPAVERGLAAGAKAGAFSLSIASPRLILKIVAWCANLRSRLEGVPYGDQAHFVRADTFRTLGGYAAFPIMEDVEFFQRVKQQQIPMVILREKIATSSRRWDNEGVLFRTVNNWILRVRYALGASPARLVERYRPHTSKVESE